MDALNDLELLLDTVLESYTHEVDHDAVKMDLIVQAEEHIACHSNSLNQYAMIAHDLYAVANQRRDNDLFQAAILLYATGMARHHEFTKLKKVLPNIDPRLPGAKRLPHNKAIEATLYFERDGRFDLAARLWEKRGDYELARAYRAVEKLKADAVSLLPVQ